MIGLGAAALLGAADSALTAALGFHPLVTPPLIGGGIGWSIRRANGGQAGRGLSSLAVLLAYAAINVGRLPMIEPAVWGALDRSPQSILFFLLLPTVRTAKGRVFGGVADLAFVFLGLFQTWRFARRRDR